MKRLRKLHENQDIKYFGVGEYGTKNERPHYHAIIFNADAEKIERAWALDNRKIGDIYIGNVSEASIVYTLKYMCKHQRIEKNDEYGRQMEFRVMSKGMGAAYITEQMKRWHLQDLGNRMYIPLMDGKKIAMPRYYKERIYTEKQRKIAGKMLQKQLQELEEKIRQETPDFEDFMMNQKEAIINKHNYRSKTRQKL